MSNSEDEIRIIASQLRAARESVGLTIEQAAQLVHVQGEDLAQWEEGEGEPSAEQLGDIGELYGRATDYFLKAIPPPPAQVAFRLPRNRTLQDLALPSRRALARFEELCRAAAELEEIAGVQRSWKIPVAEHETPRGLASRERARLGLDDRPIPDLRALLERQGVRIFELAVEDDTLSGLSYWHEVFGPCVLLNARDEPGRRTFTLAHEYAHIVRIDSPHVCNPSARIDTADERFANAFAADLLMPEPDVVRSCEARGISEGPLVTQELAALARRYHVSLHAMAIRLEELKAVPAGTTASLVAEWESIPRIRRRPKTPSWRRRLGEEYVSLASRAYGQGMISVGKLAEYLGLPIRDAMAIAQEAKRERQQRG